MFLWRGLESLYVGSNYITKLNDLILELRGLRLEKSAASIAGTRGKQDRQLEEMKTKLNNIY